MYVIFQYTDNITTYKSIVFEQYAIWHTLFEGHTNKLYLGQYSCDK